METDETKDFGENPHELVQNMRKTNLVQLETLCKMHLSFEIDLDLDSNSLDSVWDRKPKLWTKFQKKTKGCTSTLHSPINQFQTITQFLLDQLEKLIFYLIKEENLTQEGIFRKTGSVARQNELKLVLFENSDVNLDEAQYTSHDCASVMKTILSELEEPILTLTYYSAFQQVAGETFFFQF